MTRRNATRFRTTSQPPASARTTATAVLAAAIHSELSIGRRRSASEKRRR